MAKKRAKKTYAAQAKQIMARYKPRLGDNLTELDPMAEKSLMAELQALRNKQEITKQALAPKETQGALPGFYQGGILDIPPGYGEANLGGGFNNFLPPEPENPYIDPLNTMQAKRYNSSGTPDPAEADNFVPRATAVIPPKLGMQSLAPGQVDINQSFATPTHNTGISADTMAPAGDPADLKTSAISGTDAMIYGAQALPAVANLARGVFGKAEQLDAEDYQVTPTPIDAPEYDASEAIRGIEGQTNISRRNLRNSMAGQIAAQTAGDKALSSVNQYKENVDAQNQFQADRFNAVQDMQAQGQNAQMGYGVDQFNLQSKAAKDNLTSLGLSQLSELGQYVGTNELYQTALKDNKTYMKQMIDAQNKNLIGDQFEFPEDQVTPVTIPGGIDTIPDYDSLEGDGINDVKKPTTTKQAAATTSTTPVVEEAVEQATAPITTRQEGYNNIAKMAKSITALENRLAELRAPKKSYANQAEFDAISSEVQVVLSSLDQLRAAQAGVQNQINSIR